MPEDDLLTVSEIAARLKVSEETVRQWLRKSQIKGYNLGGRSGWRIPAAEIETFLLSKRTNPSVRTSRSGRT